MYFSDAPQIEEISINKMITKSENIKPSLACFFCHNGNICKLSDNSISGQKHVKN